MLFPQDFEEVLIVNEWSIVILWMIIMYIWKMNKWSFYGEPLCRTYCIYLYDIKNMCIQVFKCVFVWHIQEEDRINCIYMDCSMMYWIETTWNNFYQYWQNHCRTLLKMDNIYITLLQQPREYQMI